MRLLSPAGAGGPLESRPAALIDALSTSWGLTFVPESTGRSGELGADVVRAVGLLRPSRQQPPSAVLHPLHFYREGPRAMWVDAYDDWSLAPDMSLWVRRVAALGYRRLRTAPAEAARLITVNSPYMRDKLLPARSVLVPNGVSPELAEVELGGDDLARVLILGNFFPGRTDYELTRKILMSRSPDEVIVFGGDQRVLAMVDEARSRGRQVTQLPRTPMRDIADLAGARTIMAIPHVVSDYTMSQDVMKAYQAVTLGIPICLPNPLWPHAIDRGLGTVFEEGTDPEDVLAGSFDWRRLDRVERRAFAFQHSWARRAATIAEELGVLAT